MSKPTVVVFPATSNTGVEAVKALVSTYKDKVTIRCVVRKSEKGRMFEGLPVEVVRADVNQPSLLGAAFDDNVDTAYWATPTSEDRVELTKKFIDACIQYGVDHPIILSVLDADKKAIKYQRQFAEIEEYCKEKAGTPVKKQVHDTGKQVLGPVILRSAFFYQNFFGSIGGIQSGRLYYPLGQGGAAGKMPHVDLQDLGQVVAKILAKPEPHANKTYNLIGEYQAGNQLAQAMSIGTKHTIVYEDVDPDTASNAFQALGLPAWLADGNVEMLQYFSVNDNGQDISSDVPKLLGRPAIKFQAFCREFVKPLLEE